MITLQIVLDVLMVGAAIAGGVTDVLDRKIYDWLSLPALALGLVLHAVGYGFGEIFGVGLLSSLLGASFCAVVFGAFWVWRRGFGLGDVKLLAAMGALVGFQQALTVAMCVTLVGFVMALARIIFGPSGLQVAKQLFRFGQASAEGRATVPYGIAIALGAIWATFVRYHVLGLGFF